MMERFIEKIGENIKEVKFKVSDRLVFNFSRIVKLKGKIAKLSPQGRLAKPKPIYRHFRAC